MIVQCTVENVKQVTEYARTRQLIYLKVEKNQSDIIMDYSLIKDINDESEIERIKSIIKDSIRTSFDLINKLNQLSNILSHNVQPMSYQLVYDCTVNGNTPMFDYSSMLPVPEEVLDIQETINIDWNTVFKDKLDETIPDLYIKKSPKKYSLVTYRELIKILNK